MAALYFVEQGKLALNEDVNRRLVSWKVPENEYTKTEKVTLRRILSHSAGLTVHAVAGYSSGSQVPSLIDILNGEKGTNSEKVVVDFVPGSKMRYSGGGFCVLQQLLVDVGGKSFPVLMQETVLSKLGMSDSTFDQPVGGEFRKFPEFLSFFSLIPSSACATFSLFFCMPSLSPSGLVDPMGSDL